MFSPNNEQKVYQNNADIVKPKLPSTHSVCKGGGGGLDDIQCLLKKQDQRSTSLTHLLVNHF